MADLFTEEEFRPHLAPRHARIFAICLDYLLLIVILAIFYGEWFKSNSQGVKIGFELINPNPVVSIVLWILLFPFLESFRGQTIGKRLLRVRVLSDNYNKASSVQCIVRHLFDLIDFLPFFGLIGIIVSSGNQRKKRVGDLVANTIVVDSRRTT